MTAVGAALAAYRKKKQLRQTLAPVSRLATFDAVAVQTLTDVATVVPRRALLNTERVETRGWVFDNDVLGATPLANDILTGGSLVNGHLDTGVRLTADFALPGVRWSTGGTTGSVAVPFTVSNTATTFSCDVLGSITATGGTVCIGTINITNGFSWYTAAEPSPLNHRGEPVRGYFKDKQFCDANPAELLALSLLRKMVAPEEFRRYLRNGFVVVRGASGLAYQIGRHAHYVEVRERGVHLASLCVQVKDNSIPPTDAVVSKMLIVECDEADIWRRANVTWRGDRRHPIAGGKADRREAVNGINIQRGLGEYAIMGAVG